MPRPASHEARVRLNLDLPVSVRERMDHVREMSEADTISEVIRRSLAVYEALLDITHGGAKIVTRRRDGTETVVLATDSAPAPAPRRWPPGAPMKAHLDPIPLAIMRVAPVINAALHEMTRCAAALGQQQIVPDDPRATVRDLRAWMLERREASLRAGTPADLALVAAIDDCRFF